MEDTPAPELTTEEAMWSVNLFCEAFSRLRWVAVYLDVQGPNDPLQRTVKDFTFKIHIFAGGLERSVLGPDDDDNGDDGVFDDGDTTPAPTPTPTPTVGLLRRRLPLLN
jgi:hypothetical protein